MDLVLTIRKENRMLRKCLIPIIGNIIACPVNILRFATMGLYLDILERKIENEPLKRELQKVYEQIDKNFEKRVCQEIINELSAKARNNVYKIPI